MIIARGNWFFILLSILTTAFMAKPYMYVIQQDNYKVKKIFKSKSLRSSYLIDLIAALIFGGIYIGVSFVESRIFWGFLDAMFFFIAETVLYFAEDTDKKKPFKYTKRAVRGLVAVTLVSSALICSTLFLLNGLLDGDKAFYRYSGFFVFPIFYPLIFAVTIWLVNIFENLNNLRYERKTKKILQSNSDLIKIGITGSFGKTSVKNFLRELLEIKYRVLSTPESYNTPMGISKAVGSLDPSHEVFIAEMGARRVGDIKKLMKLVKPEIGILTGVNTQHLATFRTQENIFKEKIKVLSMLPFDGAGFVNSSLSREMQEAGSNLQRSIIFAGREGDVCVSDVATCSDGTVFNLHFGDEVVAISTKLIGSHNVENLALASAVAHYMGVKIEHIAEKISHIEPVPHRLQLMSRNGIRIIDDTFNSNPDGARIAIETLGHFSGRKVVITPGLVELGETENQENFVLGEEISKVADVVVLVGGRRTEYILKGLGDFSGKIFRFETLEEAQKSFKDFLHMGDVVLLLNDLPDIYED